MSTSSSRGVRLACVIITLSCLLAGAVVGVLVASLRVAGKPQVFHSIAKLVAGGYIKDKEPHAWQVALEDHYGTIIETLESVEMLRKACERVHALHPNLQDSEVSITVRQTKGTTIFNILATGSDPKYTQILLNALVDEFVAFRQAIREEAQGRALGIFLQEVVNKQKTMEDAQEAKAAMERDAKTVLARIDLERLKERLKLLSNERDDLRMALKVPPADAEAKKERVRRLDEEIQRIGVEITEAEAVLVKLKAASQLFETANEAYQKMFQQAETIQGIFNNAMTEYVAIQERASVALEQVEDWKMPLILGGASGAALGLAGGLVISFFIVAIGSSKQSG